jgi:5-methylcytosine-specific restriction endonuclease McrA
MKNHTKIYLKYFGYGIDDYIPCEVCDNKAVDIHHIEARGMGGSNTKDVIENLQALCRQCHLDLGDKEQYMQFLKDKHNELIRRD